MKKATLAIFLLCAAIVAQAQQSSQPAAAAAPGVVYAQASSEHYAVYSEVGEEHAGRLSRYLEGLYGLYDSWMRFDAKPKARLTLRAFKDKSAFDDYLFQVVGSTKDDFVYLHYPTAERSELVVFEKAESDFAASLAHQAFIQFLKAFIPNPPLWLREGFAVFFETARWDDQAGVLSFQENLAWLETVKQIKDQNRLLDIEALISLGQDEAKASLDVFYPQSWAFVSFLANSADKHYNRFLWDSISALGREASYDENQQAILAAFRTWYPRDSANEDFLAFLEEQKTFPELVTMGVRLYGEKNWTEADAAFAKAMAKNDKSYIPYYYLGLIAYAKNDFAMAEYYYKTALGLGCDAAITNYALGINAYASNRYEDAKTYLTAAKTANPERYTTKADELIAKMIK